MRTRSFRFSLQFFCAGEGYATPVSWIGPGGGLGNLYGVLLAALNTAGRKQVFNSTPNGKRKQINRAGNHSHMGPDPLRNTLS